MGSTEAEAEALVLLLPNCCRNSSETATEQRDERHLCLIAVVA